MASRSYPSHSLTLPKLFGNAVDQATRLLTQGPGMAEEARNALLVTAGLVILASSLRGFLTGFGGYIAEVVSQKVGYDLRTRYGQELAGREGPYLRSAGEVLAAVRAWGSQELSRAGA